MCIRDSSEEEQKIMRETLRKVWSDPEVLSARHDIHQSIKQYQVTLKATIAKQDPEAAKLIEKMQKSGSGGMLDSITKGYGGGAHKRGPHHQRSIEQMLASPYMLEKLTPAQKTLFKTASMEALKQPQMASYFEPVKTILKEEEKLWKKQNSEDKVLREKKMEALRSLRVAYFETIVALEPSLKEPISKLPTNHPNFCLLYTSPSPRDS